MLKKDWLTADIIDFEYKKYILLAYLQEVEKAFNQYKLYPELGELVEHYRRLLDFNTSTEMLKQQVKGDLKEIDMDKLELVYEKTLLDDHVMEELEMIVNYSLPKLKYHLNLGKDHYEQVESQLRLEPIGIVPLYKNEGYLLLKTNDIRETSVFQYRISLFEDAHDRYRSIHTTYVNTYRNSLINTFEGIKGRIIAERKELPNPATYLIESEKQYPVNETLLPIARRMLVRYLATSA